MEQDVWVQQWSGQHMLEQVVETNSYTKRFGLQLSQKEAELLIQERKETLQEEQRIEFKGGILPKLIQTFCDSPYIYQDNYVDTIGRLQQIFYLYKNESMDELTDDELMEYMKREFDGTCQGSLDYLEDTSLEKFARKVRGQTRRFLGRYEREVDEDE